MSTTKPLAWGAASAVGLLLLYLSVLALISGASFARDQFAQFWPYVIALAAGFGLQVGMFTRLRALAGSGHGKVVAASGTTSTAAMVSCCAHYLTNVAPVLGATGIVAFAAQYQVELLWAGLVFNAAGIAFIGNRLLQATREHAKCAIA